MKSIFFLMACLMMVLGCGDSDDSQSSGTTPGDGPNIEGPVPYISQLEYDPKSAAPGEGGGAVAVRGTFDFFDQDGDLSTIRVCTPACGEDPEICDDTPVFGEPGDQSGTLNVSFQMKTTCGAGEHHTTVMVLDDQGHESNTLTATFTIR